MAFTSEDLILAVMRRPALWDPNDPGYNDKEVVHSMWKQIQQLNKHETVDRIKKKWKNLKDQYRKELKKYLPPRSGQSAPKPKATWKHFDTMAFVRDQLSRNVGEHNMDTHEVSTDDSDEDQDKPLQEILQTRGRASSPAPSESSSTASRKRSSYDLRVEFLNIQKKKLMMQQKEFREKRKREKFRDGQRSDDDYMYLMTLLPHMKRFTEAQKLRVRARIYSVVLSELGEQGLYGDEFAFENKMHQ